MKNNKIKATIGNVNVELLSTISTTTRQSRNLIIQYFKTDSFELGNLPVTGHADRQYHSGGNNTKGSKGGYTHS